MRRQGRGLSAVGLLGVILYLAAAFTPLPSLLARRLAVPPEIGPTDAIVVLGSDLRPDGTLDGPSLRRAVAGIVLQRRGLAPLLVFSGVTPAEGPAEAEVRADLARTLGVPDDRIVAVLGARNTREEAVRVGALLRARGARQILLVSDSQHLVRARPLFEQAGVRVLAVPADEQMTEEHVPGGRVILALRVVRESLARLYYRLAGHLR